MNISKICNKCGKELPIEKFRLVHGQFNNPYYLGQCKDCEYKTQRKYLEDKKKVVFSDNLKILIHRQFKEILPDRVLCLEKLGIDLISEDELFVKLSEYKDIWISNYGRAIKYDGKKYCILKGSYDSCGCLKYRVKKNIFINGKWRFQTATLYAQKAVVEEFIVNSDCQSNIYIWHRGYDKYDNYYKHLYPLNREQYKAIKATFIKSGSDDEDFIIKVMNDIRYKPDDWSVSCMKPIMCGIGYRGCDDADTTSESYLRWHDMINRCYNEAFHERQSQYKSCKVCEEWKNYKNFRYWFDKHRTDIEKLDLDKDILVKGNKEYSAYTCAFVPHAINTLFVNCKKNRGDLPVGVFFEEDKNKYRAAMSFMENSIKLGTFDTREEAFNRYKAYKKDFIDDMAEQYKEIIPFRVYEAMKKWKIEEDD